MVTVTKALMTEVQFLYKIEFDKAARANGGSVIWSGQHGMLWALNQAGEISEVFWLGVCAGLAIEWLKEQADPLNHPFTQQQLEARREVFHRPADAYERAKGFGSQVFSSHRKQNQQMKGLDGLVASAGATRESQYPFRDISACFSHGRLYYISSGSHAMAAAKVGGSRWGGTRFDFYDPNVGVAKRVKANMFRQYLKAAVDAGFQVAGGADKRAEKKMSVQPFKRL